jgi:hypothetical protein
MEQSLMTIASLGAHCRNAAAPALLAAGMLLGSVCVAQAQLNPQELLKQVLPGASGGDTGDDDAAGERACQRYAEKQGLDVRRVRDSRPSGSNNLEIILSVEDRNDRYDARCIYDSKDEEVRELEPVSASQDDEVSERLAQRAQKACQELAEDRDLDDVDFAQARARGEDTVEIDLRARVRGERQDLTCLYDDDQRHAVLAD